MIERVIENWLTNIDERGYQTPFRELLLLKGYRVVHVSHHGAHEQGKDIIAVDPSGHPCAYQLKAGDISLSEWRNVIRGETDDLLDLPIVHPSIDKTKGHSSFLVLTGRLADEVRRSIDDQNELRKREGKATLQTIVFDELLKDFVEASEQYLPKQLDDLRVFLNLYSVDGGDLLHRPEFTKFLASIVPEQDNNKRSVIRAAANLILFASYLLSTHEKEKNYWAVADGWIVTAATVMELGERYDCIEDLEDSLSLCMSSIDGALHNLTEEALQSTDLLQGGSLIEGQVYPFRATILVGYLSAYSLFAQLQGKDDPELSRRVDAFMTKYDPDLKLYGEVATPYFACLFWHHFLGGKFVEAGRIVQTLVNTILDTNKDGNEGVVNPYYETEETFRHFMGMLDEPIDETFRGGAFTLEPLVLLMAKYKMRAYLEKNWKKLTHLEMSEFEPKDLWEYFAYRAVKGNKKSHFLNQTQSFAVLRQEAMTYDETKVPKTLLRHPEFLPLFWLVYPHRFTPNLVKFFDGTVFAKLVDQIKAQKISPPIATGK